MASYFNHSCDCNATAVQADGSMEVVTGLDVLGLIDSEAAQKTAKEEAGLTVTPLSKQVTPSTSTSSLSSSLLSDTPPVEAVEAVEACTGDSVGVQGNDGDTDEERAVASEPPVDPYESRMGEFRMMTFYSTRDIAKGMQNYLIRYPKLPKLETAPTASRFFVFFLNIFSRMPLFFHLSLPMALLFRSGYYDFIHRHGSAFASPSVSPLGRLSFPLLLRAVSEGRETGTFWIRNQDSA